MNEDILKQYLNGLYDNDATTLYKTPMKTPLSKP